MALRQATMVITVCYETQESNYPRTKKHIPDRVTEALARVSNVKMEIGFFDENTRLRRVELEVGSPALKALADQELGLDDEVVA